jgi:hypothetical protein
LEFGWVLTPGTSHICWFDQIYLDDGDDMDDPGDKRSTAKLPASVNEDNWDTTGGTGAVNERPLSVTNYKQHAASSGVRQTYTLQSAATGDVDISGNTIAGYMGWAWAKKGAGDDGDLPALIVNNVVQPIILTTTPKLFKFSVASSSYPSHAAGIGMRSNEEAADTFMYEAGAVVVYEGPNINPNRILAYQRLEENTILDLVDDLRVDPPDSYELCYRIEETPATVLITAYSITAEGQEPQLQATNQAQGGGGGRTRITGGIEVQIRVEVTGGSARVGIWHRLNVD